MTVLKCLYLTAMVLAVIGWEIPAHAEADVTVISTNAAPTPPAQKTVASDGTPVVHKSLHKKKHSTTATQSSAVATTTAQRPFLAATSTASAKNAPLTNPDPVSAPAVHPAALVPTVETGLPVARYPAFPRTVQRPSRCPPGTSLRGQPRTCLILPALFRHP